MSEEATNNYLATSQITKIANSSQPATKILRSLARTAVRALQASGCSILVLDSGKQYLSSIAAFGLSDLFLRKGSLKAEESLPEVTKGKVVYVRDIRNDIRIHYRENCQNEGILSLIGIPIFNKSDVIGQVRVYYKEKREFSTGEKDFAISFANLVGMVLDREKLESCVTTQVNRPVAEKIITLSKPVTFSHPSEEDFARLLDFYHIDWLYEPRAFPLEWQGERVIEMFTPDFYLPELDFYVELTTLKQSLITDKRRKIRRIHELYPEVSIRLLNKNDYLKILDKLNYKFENRSNSKGVGKILFSHGQIQRRVREISKRISKDYEGREPILIGVLKGVVPFLSDLMRNITLPVSIDFMALSYYQGGDGGVAEITKDIDIDIKGEDVIMVEDIVDTGMTLNYVLNHLRDKNPASLRVCALLDKRARRLVEVPLNYVGFKIPDEYIVGYGLDYLGKYRNLPFVSIMNPENVGLK